MGQRKTGWHSQKKLDTSYINKLGWKSKTNLDIGIEKTIYSYKNQLITEDNY